MLDSGVFEMESFVSDVEFLEMKSMPLMSHNHLFGARLITYSNVLREASLQSSFSNNNGALNRGSGNIHSPSLTQDVEAKFVIPRSGKAVKSNSGCVKRPRMVQMDFFKHKSGIRYVNGIPHEIASAGYPGQQRAKVAELSKFGHPMRSVPLMSHRHLSGARLLTLKFLGRPLYNPA